VSNYQFLNKLFAQWTCNNCSFLKDRFVSISNRQVGTHIRAGSCRTVHITRHSDRYLTDPAICCWNKKHVSELRRPLLGIAHNVMQRKRMPLKLRSECWILDTIHIIILIKTYKTLYCLHKKLRLFPFQCKLYANSWLSSSYQWLRRPIPRKPSDWQLRPISHLHLFPGYSHKHDISAPGESILTFKKPTKLQQHKRFKETRNFLLHYEWKCVKWKVHTTADIVFLNI
jgi:hypothetical protein